MRSVHLVRLLLASLALASASPLTTIAQDKSKPAAVAPATAKQAAEVLRLDELPLLDGAGDPNVRLITSLAYPVKQSVKKCYANVQKQLVARGWTELDSSSVTDDYASGTFRKKGFHVSLSIMPSDPSNPGKEALVRLQQHGNVELGKLPTGTGAKPIYVGPVSAIYSSDESPKKLTAAIREQLLSAGWEPYGGTPEISEYRQHGVILNCMVMDAPPPSKGANIQYSARMVDVEIPAPSDASEVRFADDIRQLNFDSPLDATALADFYRQRLAPAGWRPTTENWVEDSGTKTLIFSTKAGDLLQVQLNTVAGNSRVTIRHQSAAEVAAETKRFQAAADKAKMKKENAPSPEKIRLTAPDGAKQLAKSANSIQWQVDSGKAMKHVRTMRSALIEAGWKETSASLDALAGVVLLERMELKLTIDYTDTGVLPAEISVRASQCELE